MFIWSTDEEAFYNSDKIIKIKLENHERVVSVIFYIEGETSPHEYESFCVCSYTGKNTKITEANIRDLAHSSMCELADEINNSDKERI